MAKFGDILCAEKVYIIEDFLVSQAEKKFRVTKHKFKITFMAITKIKETKCDSIPTTKFNFVPFSQILSTADDQYLIG
jgi:hypothetical protein